VVVTDTVRPQRTQGARYVHRSKHLYERGEPRKRAQHLYEKLGFRETHRKMGPTGLEIIYYERELNDGQ
jgi:hypothetical protein